MGNYKQLIVWQKSISMVEMIYILVKCLPREELFGLSDQMRRAAVSIPSNIAEGQERGSTKEFKHFIMIAQGSRAELETQIELCRRLGYLSSDNIVKAVSLCDEISRMLRTLVKRLDNSQLETHS